MFRLQRRSRVYTVTLPIVVGVVAAWLYMSLLRGASPFLLRSCYSKVAGTQSLPLQSTGTKQIPTAATTFRSGFFSFPEPQFRMASTTAQPGPQLHSKPEAETSTNNTCTPLPPLSTSDFRIYNRLADMMEAYHSHFRQTWTTMQTACTANARPQGMSIRAFLGMGSSFVSQITMHHSIEETHIYPMLATKMPQFRETELLKRQHDAIHVGLDAFEAYIGECRRGERELRLGELGAIMEGFGEVLWEHLDDEVRELGAERMRVCWSTEEVRGMLF